MVAMKRVILAFGDAPSPSAKRLVEVEVDVTTNGGFEKLTEVAEAEFDLQAKSFDFVHGHCTIDTCVALNQALHDSDDGACMLEVYKHTVSTEPGVGAKRSLTARMRAVEHDVESLESKILNKVDAKLREMNVGALANLVQHVCLAQMRVDEQLREMNVGALANLVQHICLEQMSTRSWLNDFDEKRTDMQLQLRELDDDVAALKADAGDAAMDLAAKALPAGPSFKDSTSSSIGGFAGSLAQLDELCSHLTCKLEASSLMEASISQKVDDLQVRTQSTEDSIESLRADMQKIPRGQNDEAPAVTSSNDVFGTPAALAQLDELCQQLTSKLEATSGMESEIRQQIAEVRNRAQTAEESIHALREDVRHAKESATPKNDMFLGAVSKSFQPVDFSDAWPSSLGSMHHFKADLNRAPVAYSAKGQRKLQFKVEQQTNSAVPFALRTSAYELDRVQSCPTLPPLSPAR